MGLRAARQTSMARMSLGVSLAWMRAADAGSRRARSRWSQPCTVSFGAAAEALAEVFVARGPGEEAFGEGAEVEAGSTGDDGEFVAGGDVAESCAGAAAVFARGEGLVGIGDVDEVMGDAGAVFECGLGGAEVHAAIDGDGIAGDDFAVEVFGEGERERGFAAAGGAEEKERERVRRRG